MSAWKFIALGLIIWSIVTVGAARAQTYTPTSIDVSTDGIQHSLTMYANVKFVEEDDKWIPVQDAKSLMDKTWEGRPLFYVDYLKKDERYDFEILDFNYTDIKFNMILKDDKLLNEAIPFRVDEKAVIKDKKVEEKVFTSLDEKATMEYKTDNIFAKNYTIGSASTTIMIRGNVSSSTADLRYFEVSPFNSGTQQKWNISAIPNGVLLDEAMVCYHAFEYYDATGAFDADVDVWRVNDQAWDESINIAAFNAQTLTNAEEETWNLTFVGVQWSCFSVYTQLNVDYIANNDFFTLRFEDPDASVAAPTTVTPGSENTFGYYKDALDNRMVKLSSRDLVGGGTNVPELTVEYTLLLAPKVEYEPNVLVNHSHVINATFLISDYGMDMKANINYNDTIYSNDSVSMNATHISLWRTFTAPEIVKETEIIQFSFNFSNASYNTNTTNYTQTITRPFVILCNSSYIQGLRFIFRNETSDFGIVNATMNAHLWFYIGSDMFTYNFTTTNETVRLCLFPNSTNVSLNGQIQYINSSYSTRDFNFRNMTMDNVSDDFDLYLLDVLESDRVTFSVNNEFGSPYPNVIVEVQRYYPETNSYRSVAAPISDSSGTTNSYLVLYDVYYRFVLKQAGNTLSIITPRLITSSEISLVVNPSVIIDWLKLYGHLTGTCVYNSVTGYINCDYADDSDLVSYMKLRVERHGTLDKVTICDSTNTSMPGSFACFIGANTTDTYAYTMSAKLTTGTQDEFRVTAGLIELYTYVSNLFGNCKLVGNIGMCMEGVAMTLIITLAAAMVGVFSPSTSILMMMGGLGISIYTGMFAISTSMFIGLVFVAGIVIYRMRG